MPRKRRENITIDTLDDLQEIIEKANEEDAAVKYCLRVCQGTGCVSQNSPAVRDAMETRVSEKGLDHDITIKGVGCKGLCAAGPLVLVSPSDTMYHDVSADDVPEIIDSLNSEPVERLVIDTDLPFFQRQERIVLANSGKIDPDSIIDYVQTGGYAALVKAVTEMSPRDVIDEVVTSGLRGRGGGGYPTGLKWTTVSKAESDAKYVICNADEGDPGAFMDRSILESDPHRVLEGMAIAAYAVGANKGYIYIRAEYPLAIERLTVAIRLAKRSGVLGHQIFGSPFDFDVELRLGAGTFVCGEETALIASIEGNRGLPRPRPPYPADYGLWGKPTLINNVETLANIPPIIDKGGEWYASIGTESSKGTKVFALAGQINNTGLIEVPMGITLRDIVFDIGGGLPDGRSFKAIQTGGPSGGCVPEEYLDMPVDYESLREVGSFMGSGGMIVMDDSSSMVEVARFFMEFSMIESCGKCIPCRVGTRQMYDLLTRIVKGQGQARDLELLRELCDLCQQTSLCGLGRAAPNPVISTLRYFEDEYLELLTDDTLARAAMD